MRERAAGTTVSILTVFSFYGAEDYTVLCIQLLR